MHFGLLKARGFISAVTGQYNINPVNGPTLPAKLSAGSTKGPTKI